MQRLTLSDELAELIESGKLTIRADYDINREVPNRGILYVSLGGVSVEIPFDDTALYEDAFNREAA